MNLEYFALCMMAVVGVVLFYAVIAVHDIPYEIAKKRGHPHLDAIHVAGWVSMFTLHAIWPFLWIWATLYDKERGYGMATGGTSDEVLSKLTKLEERLAALESSTPGKKD